MSYPKVIQKCHSTICSHYCACWCPGTDDHKGDWCHDDVTKWKLFPRYWPFVRGIHRSPVNSPHKGQWRRALMYSLICARINDWVNNREAGDLRRHQAHCDVIVMCKNDDHDLVSIHTGLTCRGQIVKMELSILVPLKNMHLVRFDIKQQTSKYIVYEIHKRWIESVVITSVNNMLPNCILSISVLQEFHNTIIWWTPCFWCAKTHGINY